MNDILIIGTGPAAMQLSAKCADQQMSTSCVSPAPEQCWIPRYGSWSDELDGAGLPSSCVEMQWDQTTAFTPAEQDLQRGYTRLSTDGLQQHLCQGAAQAGVTMVQGTVHTVEHHDSHSTAILDSGETLSARVIVDASGHTGGFVQRSGDFKRSWQHAYGVTLRVSGGHPWPLGQMVLMDFRLPEGSSPEWRQLPTFLYAMPLDREHVFVEETSLVHFQPPSLDVLRERLWLRLNARGVSGTVLEEERCRIQMTGPPVVPNQRLLAYGAAADMIHPATGYQLARVLDGAAPLAAAIATGLDRDGPQAAAQEAWASLWPMPRRRSWALYRFGATILADLNHAQTVAFFSSFFHLPADLWQGFHSATLPPSGVARAMATFFLNAPPPIRRVLFTAGVSRPGATLLHAVARP